MGRFMGRFRPDGAGSCEGLNRKDGALLGFAVREGSAVLLMFVDRCAEIKARPQHDSIGPLPETTKKTIVEIKRDRTRPRK